MITEITNTNPDAMARDVHGEISLHPGQGDAILAATGQNEDSNKLAMDPCGGDTVSFLSIECGCSRHGLGRAVNSSAVLNAHKSSSTPHKASLGIRRHPLIAS